MAALAFVRRWFPVLAVVAAASFAPTVRAEDAEGPEGHGEMGEPEHSAYDMALAAAGLPEGWKLVPSAEGAADENALKDAVVATVKDSIKPDAVHFVMRSATTPDGKKAVFALVDLDEKAPKAVDALGAAAAAKGWTVRTLGAPTRLLVVAAPADVAAKATEVQTAYAARMLAVKASAALENRNARRAFLLGRAVLALDGKHAVGHMVVGQLLLGEGTQAKQAQGDGADELLAKAVVHLRAAVAKDATGTLTPGERATTLGELGLGLLYTKKADAEARDVLKEAVAGTFDSPRTAAVARYNLACAHGRLKELDAAFKELATVLEAESKSPADGQLLGAWRADEDFTNLRADPRWAELEKKYPAPGGMGDH